MSFTILSTGTIFLVLSWLIARALLLPKPISEIPYSRLSYCMPWGELASLGIHTWCTGEVFSWLSKQCVDHKSALVQIFIPSFSTTRPTLVLADLSEIEDIVTKRIAEIDRADLMHTWFGLLAPGATIGLKSRDSQFRRQRRLWNVILSPKFLNETAAPCFVEVAKKLSDIWVRKAELAGSCHAFEAQEDIKHATLDGMWKMGCGAEMGLQAAKIERLRKPAAIRMRGSSTVEFAMCKMPDFYDTLGTLLLCLDWAMQGVSPRMYTWFFRSTGILPRAEIKKDIILDQCIAGSRERVLKETQGLRCALDEILLKDIRLQSVSRPTGPTQSDAALRDELLELLITGHETTASSIAWALKYLTNNPESQSRLRASLYSASLNTDVTAQDIVATSVPYLDAVIAETLRLSATGPVSFRQTLLPCEILGHAIPAGTPIILVTAGPSYASPAMPAIPLVLRSSTSQAALLRKEKSSPHPKHCMHDLQTFAPERWLVDDRFDPNAVHMLPFSTGPRGCFGKKIAMLEMRVVIAILVLRFEFPRLEAGLSGSAARDGLTRRPTRCYVSPVSGRLGSGYGANCLQFNGQDCFDLIGQLTELATEESDRVLFMHPMRYMRQKLELIARDQRVHLPRVVHGINRLRWTVCGTSVQFWVICFKVQDGSLIERIWRNDGLQLHVQNPPTTKHEKASSAYTKTPAAILSSTADDYEQSNSATTETPPDVPQTNRSPTSSLRLSPTMARRSSRPYFLVLQLKWNLSSYGNSAEDAVEGSAQDAPRPRYGSRDYDCCCANRIIGGCRRRDFSATYIDQFAERKTVQAHLHETTAFLVTDSQERSTESIVQRDKTFQTESLQEA
ncbi:cytochrome P450 [Karstenula rhodostoma CBS 690.94]|uniref:Cytochrome P450 n=1 Tax=Karstenula rhodostoma CBS 690.94 TaxID=1392251 RepID=A0A9P4U9V6_9PLEO|nr:cytochrome P450 [Karstenula rhodostoma CBS 690.94]